MNESAPQQIANRWTETPATGEAPQETADQTVFDPKLFQYIPPTTFRSEKKQRKERAQQQKTLPPILDDDSPCSNEAYNTAKNDPNLTFSAQKLGFLPASYWVKDQTTFDELITKFFQRKNNSNCRFPHKLYNALAIVENNQSMWNLVGVKWITDIIFKVDKYVFGRLLGISSIDGGLFHRQGNFPSHGFVEVPMDTMNEMRDKYDLDDVDLDRIHLIQHRTGLFSRNSSEESITNCRWSE
ncbi:hypothetical protein GPJ56_009614 [Histomonas meleagridis]|uniref:uncharacterized protein n=1 Tax=Histomonas meleagridis TaxID=135588 RepID=UPI003559702D|nr:hypothetical protein GPJ56_009614 [Histomonas meleagridis]KAH0799619.1 hypothetical protein GO595_007533 [Histomonas meleagridis]